MTLQLQPTFILPGAKLGHKNRERVRRYYLEHIGCSQKECARDLGLSSIAVNRHVAQAQGGVARP